MYLGKIKNQFNLVFIFIIILALLSFFTAYFSVKNVSNSYENVLSYSLPIMNKSSAVAQLAAQLEANLIQLHFDAINSPNSAKIKKIQIDKLSQQWLKIENLLDELLMYKIINDDIILNKKD